MLCFLYLYAVTLQAQLQQGWFFVGSPPPRISGIAYAQDSVWISTEQGTFVLTTQATAWLKQASVPYGRLVMTSLSEIYVLGVEVFRRESTNATWRPLQRSSNEWSKVTLLERTLYVSQATVSLSREHELLVTQGGIAVQTPSAIRMLAAYSNASQRVVGAVRLGVKIVCAFEYRIVVVEELPTDKASPFDIIPFRRFAVRELHDGLSASVDNLQVLGKSMCAGMWFSADAGKTWNMLVRDSLRAVSLVPTKDSALLARTARRILRSRDNGTTWLSVFVLPDAMHWYSSGRTQGLTKCIIRRAALECTATVFFFARDTTLYTLAPTHIVESGDGGISWQIRPIQGIPISFAIESVEQSPSGTLFARDAVFARPYVLRSRDGGVTWQQVPLGRVPTVFAVHPRVGTLFVGGVPPMWSADEGETWHSMSGLPTRIGTEEMRRSAFTGVGLSRDIFLNVRGIQGFFARGDQYSLTPRVLPSTDVYAVRALPQSVGIIALSADSLALNAVACYARTQVWLSYDNGITWKQEESGLPLDGDIVLYDIVYPVSDDSLLYATSSCGIWRFKLPGVQAPAPTAGQYQFMLSPTAEQQIHSCAYTRRSVALHALIAPQPVSQNAVLLLSLATAARVRCVIVDMHGQCVSMLSERTLSAGTHALSLLEHRVPSGVYLCSIEAWGVSDAQNDDGMCSARYSVSFVVR
ncbi:MAG: sialidase family protein [Bacteroidota bacterium]|nr:glycoside hydrolase [Candidatus Kapabacteria bacterium]MDW8220983.1 sialidase family protein [Bacteroidota bacterium]